MSVSPERVGKISCSGVVVSGVMFCRHEFLTRWLTMNIANCTPPDTVPDDLLLRICAEYAEMPGLRVTHEQAQRLWGLDATTCRQALQRLVDIDFLTLTSRGQYARLTEGPTGALNPQMLKAGLRIDQGQQRTG